MTLNAKDNWLDWVWLTTGAGLQLTVGWRYNIPVAVWLSPVFLMRFFRNRDRWYVTFAALPLFTAFGVLKIHGGWDMALGLELAIGFLMASVLFLPLYLDRLLVKKTFGLAGTLIYPCLVVLMDYLVAFLPIGSGFSPSVTHFYAKPLIQLASVTGIWGITFLLSWLVSVVNHVWDNPSDLRLSKKPIGAFLLAAAVILAAGSLRSSMPGTRQTVRIAGITVEHERDYWTEIIDKKVPKEEAHLFAQELAELEESLFTASQRTVESGARIIFWSEGNGVLYEDREAAFQKRAADFARAHQVYFAPALLLLRYGELNNDNKIIMFNPQGEIAFSYTKTKSWYPTDSDGVMRYVDTPYGRITSAICFDMDFPSFIRQAGTERADIVLVPAFDTQAIRPYHTDVGLLRGVENGFSVVRQVNKGTSMASDYHGKVLAYQDFFETPERTMLADVPISGKWTLYPVLGDWLVYFCAAYLTAVLLLSARKMRRAARAA